MYLSVNSNYSKTDCSLAKAEKNDCVVRSLASATGAVTAGTNGYYRRLQVTNLL